MKATFEHITTEKMELKIINSRLFYIIKMIGFFIGTIAILIGAPVFQRGTNGNLISRFIQLPFWIEMSLGLLSFILIALSVSLQFNKNSRKGLLQLHQDFIQIDSREIPLASIEITIFINEVKNKNIYKRSFLEGSNNWIEIKKHNKPDLKLEFLIKSKAQEDNLLGLIEVWRSKSYRIRTLNKKQSFWQSWNDF